MDSLFGMIISKWIKLLSTNKFRFSLNNLGLVFLITILGFRNSFFYRKDLILNSRNDVKIKDPIFILGHWRSGTTFLHNLMIQDSEYIYPRIFEIMHPFTFLNLRHNYMKLINEREVKERPMDNVKNDPLLPGEEEFALAAITLRSPIVGWAFPKRFDYYEQFLTLENIKSSDRKLWEKEYNSYLKKISLDSDKQLLLKSPTNTARIKFLLKLYPNAKFINIHRNPLDVFSSTKKLYATAIKKSSFQSDIKYNVENRILSTYKKVYESYFNAIDLIPKNNLTNVSFEELEKKPIESIGNIYKELSLPNYETMKPNLSKYFATLKGYKKNKHEELDNETKLKISNEWSKYYEKWGYKI